MKILRVFISLILTFCFAFTLFVGKDKIKEQKEFKSPDEYKGIITLWQVDGFEGGKGSRKQFLLKVARDFERKNKGVLVMVINQTFTSVKKNFNKGVYPDLISFSNGLEIKGIECLDLSRTVESAKIGDKVYATAWCRGGYALIKNPNAKDDKQNSIIVSQTEFTQPLTAMLLEGLEFDEISVCKPMDAYVKFTENKNAYFLGTQRDVVRLSNRGMQVEISPLNAFNDLYQYVALTCKDKNKQVFAERFVEYLVSNSVQNQLDKISMFSPYINVQYDDENLSKMQRNNKFLSISAYLPKERLKEMQEISLLAVKGEQNSINKIKNMLI